MANNSHCNSHTVTVNMRKYKTEVVIYWFEIERSVGGIDWKMEEILLLKKFLLA